MDATYCSNYRKPVNTAVISRLKKEAPGFYLLIERRLSTEAAALLANAYLCALESGGNLERSVSRAPDADFNPRPIRLAHILFHEHGERDPNTLAAGMLSSVIQSAHPRTPDLEALGAAACSIERVLGNVESIIRHRATSESSVALAISLTLALDSIRHYHMIADDSEEKERITATARFLLGTPHCREHAPRLTQLVESALRRITG